jgi:hypothetical protein
VQHLVDAAGSKPSLQQLEQILPVLRAVCGVIAAGAIRDALVDSLVVASEHLFELRELDQMVMRLDEALAWDPQRRNARERVCQMILCMAEVHAERGQIPEARLQLEEFDRRFSPQAEALAEVEDFGKRVAELRRKLDEPPTVILPPLDVVGLEEEWKERTVEAERAIPGVLDQRVHMQVPLAYLNDAADMAPSDPESRTRIVNLYLALADAVRLVADERRVLEQAQRRFPEDSDILRRLNAIKALPE